MVFAGAQVSADVEEIVNEHFGGLVWFESGREVDGDGDGFLCVSEALV